MGTKTSEKKTETSEKKKYIKVFLSEEDHETFKMYCTRAKKPMQELLEDLVKKEMQEQFYLKDQNGKTGKDGKSTSFATITQNTVFTQIFEQLEKISQRLDAVENKTGVSSPTEKLIPTEQKEIKSDRSDTEAIDNSIIDIGGKDDIANNTTDSNILIDTQDSTTVNTEHTTESIDASNNGHLDSETKKERKKRVPMPEKIVVGTKLLPNQLTRRLSEYQISLGKKSVGSGTLQNNRKNKANLSNPNYHQDWIRARDPDGILWKYIEEENIYAAIEVPKTKEIC